MAELAATTDRLGPNASLIGVPGSRARLATPCLIVERDTLALNLRTAADYAARSGIALRPHAKTHKCAAIAHLQLAQGATGIAVATVGEAERLAAAGIDNILITSTFSQPSKIERALSIARQGCRLTVVADNVAIATAIASHADAHGTHVDALVDVDLGRKRSGATTAELALAIATALAGSPRITVRGIQAYAGQLSHVADFSEREVRCIGAAQFAREVGARLAAAGFSIDVVSGASTGSMFIDASLDCYTELQCGSYVFMDVEYSAVDLQRSAATVFRPALFVQTSVISINQPDRVTVDAGYKHTSAKDTLAMVRPTTECDATYRPDSDEHGFLFFEPGATRPKLGRTVELVVPHCDPTVNLYDHFHVVDGDRLVDIWPIEARGAF